MFIVLGVWVGSYLEMRQTPEIAGEDYRCVYVLSALLKERSLYPVPRRSTPERRGLGGRQSWPFGLSKSLR